MTLVTPWNRNKPSTFHLLSGKDVGTQSRTDVRELYPQAKNVDFGGHSSEGIQIDTTRSDRSPSPGDCGHCGCPDVCTPLINGCASMCGTIANFCRRPCPPNCPCPPPFKPLPTPKTERSDEAKSPSTPHPVDR